MRESSAALTDPPMVNCAPGVRPPAPEMNTTDPDSGFQVRPRGARQPNRSEVLQREAIGEIVVGQFQELAALGGAGIVHDDVETSEPCDGEIHDALAGIGHAQIQAMVSAVPPALRISAAAASSSCWSRAHRTTLEPAAARRKAMPRPIPRLAPVTIEILPCRGWGMVIPFIVKVDTPRRGIGQ